jgi:hypothetical protein
MPYALTFNGKSIRIENSDASKPDYDFPINSTAIRFDEGASAIEFTSLGKENRVYMALGEITTPSSLDYAGLKALITTWQNSSAASTGKLIKATDSFTTAVGATPYSVNDVINPTGLAVLESINVGTNSGYITGLSIEMDNTSPLTTPNPLPTLRVRFFDAPDSSLNLIDNAADEVLWANNVRRLGYVDLTIMVADGNRLVTQDETIRFPFANLSNNTLYYRIINMVGTPTLGTSSLGRGVFVRMKVDQN